MKRNLICPNCGSKDLEVIVDDKNYQKDVHLAITGVSLYEMPQLTCKKCGFSWRPDKNNYDLNYLLKNQ